ncbi:hypothetical protein I8748_30525 [Nostoc sp. CENA67]|uniref:Uncharacterized protein n=1 Tax=Amazonocrinis nigriterrae CENA67 TaxID=2794033 RepID=A0A8J7LB84_9NOST|nr:hypothetical protein [Amazonocrinis nigriterrae]MBH8566438.1 hypothetical protein [Amazonocrinis nigriterrae CENA67]
MFIAQSLEKTGFLLSKIARSHFAIIRERVADRSACEGWQTHVNQQSLAKNHQ